MQQREPAHADAQKRSWRWLVAAFLLCPCHLPLLLVALGAGVSGGLVTRNQGALLLVMSVLFMFALWRYLAESKAEETRPCPPEWKQQVRRNLIRRAAGVALQTSFFRT